MAVSMIQDACTGSPLHAVHSFNMLSLRVPFTGKTRDEIESAIVHDDIAWGEVPAVPVPHALTVLTAMPV